jgi:hypothetical protein
MNKEVLFDFTIDKMERLLDGLRQGFTMTLSSLENLLKTLSQK